MTDYDYECIACCEEFPPNKCVICNLCGMRWCHGCNDALAKKGHNKCPVCKHEKITYIGEPIVDIEAKLEELRKEFWAPTSFYGRAKAISAIRGMGNSELTRRANELYAELILEEEKRLAERLAKERKLFRARELKLKEYEHYAAQLRYIRRVDEYPDAIRGELQCMAQCKNGKRCSKRPNGGNRFSMCTLHYEGAITDRAYKLHDRPLVRLVPYDN
jgi:uncharacterized FlgJ-related protein